MIAIARWYAMNNGRIGPLPPMGGCFCVAGRMCFFHQYRAIERFFAEHARWLRAAKP